MPITNQTAVIQALANIRLESLIVSDDILRLIEKGMTDAVIDTTYILNYLRS